MQVQDLSWHESTNKRFNSPLLPHSIRGLIGGKSGCGKNDTTFKPAAKTWVVRL